MKKIFLALACLSGVFGYFFWPKDATHPYRLAICSMFKNEAPWLKEWIVYHHSVLGAEHIYLYDNDSSDGYEEVLRPFIEKGIVELIPWSSSDPSHSLPGAESDAAFVAFQLGAFNDCVKKRAVGKAKWVAVIDIDEYIVPVHGVRSFYSMLRRSEKKRRGSVHLKWRVFGTSHVADLKPGELLTEKMILRCEDDSCWNILPKTIYQPEGVQFCLVHEEKALEPGYGARTLNADEFRIHHYWARTERFSQDHRGGLDKYEEQNQVADRTMAQYLPALKRAMNRF